jgi:predicted Na+-dependent transporter
MSMAPGIPFLVNSAGQKQGGSLSLVLTIAFCFSALSVVTIPLTLPLALPDVVAQLPVLKFLTTLVLLQLVPLIAGALAATRLSQAVSEKAARLLHLIFFAAALVLLGLLFPKIVSAVSAVAGLGQLAIIAAIGIFSAVVGWLAGGRERAYRRTLSIATLLRNIGLCVMIGSDDAFAGTLVLPTILAYVIVTFILSIPLRVAYARTKELPA